MTGQIGFDEGGVLQSLADPVIKHTSTKEKTSKKGVVTTETTTFQVTGAQMLALALVYGLVRVGDLFKEGDLPLGGGAQEAAEGFSSWLGTIAQYGVGFHYKWRGMNKEARNKWREEHGKAGGWMPPGYPAFWD